MRSIPIRGFHDVILTNLELSPTIIYFDDWGGVPEYKGGESLAWLEFQKLSKYNVKVLFDCGDGKPHRQKAFVII